MAVNKRFKNLINEGISSVSERQGIKRSEVNWQIGEELNVSSHTVQHWRRGNVPREEQQVAYLLRYCGKNGRVNRAWGESLLLQAYYPSDEIKPLLDKVFPKEVGTRRRIFLSYQRGMEPDQSVAMTVAQALNDPDVVFFDQAEEINKDWVARLQSELSKAEMVIFLLSASSIHSDVVLQEFEMVLQLPMRRRLLPVWLGYEADMPESLRSVLGKQNWSVWQSQQDTAGLLSELKRAVAGGDLPLTMGDVIKRCQESTSESSQSPRFFTVPGTAMPPDSDLYVERKADKLAHMALARADLRRKDGTRQGATIIIKGPRQMGKSSLLRRLGDAAQKMGRRFVSLDCQLLHPKESKPETFFRNFCEELGEELGLDQAVEDWHSLPSNQRRCTKYVRQILRGLDQPCVIALEKADTLLGTKSQQVFFAMLRNWHERRAYKPVWSQLDLVVVTSTEPYAFIENLHQSPFNVGTVVELGDFTSLDVADLNRRYGRPLSSQEVEKLMSLVHGHPYLVQQALYLVATKQHPARELFVRASDEWGPFGDHLRALLRLVYSNEALYAGLKNVLRADKYPGDKIFFRLRGAGLLRREEKAVVPRNKLYGDFFKKHLND